MLKTKIELKRQKEESYHDRSAHPLPPLEVGQDVRLAPQQKGKNWQPGTLVEKLRQILPSEDWKRTYTTLSQGKSQQQMSFRKVSPGVAKQGPVPATPNGKGNSPNVSEPAPTTLTDPVSDNPADLVPATPVKPTRTKVVKPDK